MAKRIGELLVERGLITPPIVEQGLETQKFQGGRVGSIWMAAGHVQERDLLDALCAQKKAKPAKASLLKSVTKATLDLLPVKVAVRYKVVPLVREARRLSVAMADPNDLLALDELQFITGCVVEPFLATERTILNALEKYYGVEPPRRDALATDIKAATPVAKPVAPPPPPTSAAPKKGEEGELFLDDAARADADSARKFWAEQLKSGNVTDPGGKHAAAGMATTVARPGGGPPPEPGAKPAAGAAKPPALPTPAAAAAASKEIGGAEDDEEVVDGNDLLVDEGDTVSIVEEPPNPLEEASRRLAKVEIRDDIADVIMWCTEGLFQRSALFIFQKTRTLGWTGQGDGLSPEVVRRVVMPVEEISVFTLIRDTPTHYQGILPRNPGNEKLAETLGGKWPPSVLVVPFGIKGRALGCLYAEDEAQELSTIDLPLLFRLLQKSGLALEILLLRSKLVLL